MKLVQGVGVNDMPKGSCSEMVDGKQVQHNFYSKWRDMIKRCYNNKLHQEHPTYSECSVCEEWKILSKFKDWFDQQPLDQHSWCLDKDLLFPDNKIYSPETCILVPQWLNKFITERNASRGKYMLGVYWHNKAGKFVSKVGNGSSGKVVYLGLFKDELSAHLAWKAAKLNLVEEMKSNLDAVDERIYPALLKRYS